MKWYAKHTHASPAEGATRLHRRFAWLPVLISGQKVWLETYEILQVWEVQRKNVVIEEKQIAFIISAWVNLSKRIIE